MAMKALRALLMLLLLAFSASTAWAQDSASLPICKWVKPTSESIPGSSAYVYAQRERPLRLHVFTPAPASRPKDRPAIMFFFGGGFVSGDPASMQREAQDFVAKGYVVVLADYRVFCRDRTGPAEAVSDGRAAHDWLWSHARKLGVDRKRIVLGGTSAGGFVATSVALGARPAHVPVALLLYNPVLDATFKGALPNFDMAAFRAVSPLYMPLGKLPPTLIFHGTADEIVPIRQPRDFCRLAIAAGRTCQLAEYPDLGHSFHFIHAVVRPLGIVPYDDTMVRGFQFLAPLAGASS